MEQYTIEHHEADIVSTIDVSQIRGWSNAGGSQVNSYAQDNVFLGVPNVTQNTLPYIEPFIGGYGRVFCLQAPIFFDPQLRGLLIRLIERFCKGLSGLSNYELQTAEITYGNTAETYTVPTGIKRGNNNFNLSFQEQQGSMFRRMMKYWITGISDLGSGYGLYHGKVYDESSPLRYNAINHTAVILYALTDNSGGAYGLDSLEFSCIWYGAFPTTIQNSHFEFRMGEHGVADMDMPFYGIYHENNTVNKFAANLLLKSNFYRDNYDEFEMGPIVNNAAEKRWTQTDDSDPAVPGLEPKQPYANQYATQTGNDAGLAPGIDNGTSS